MAPTRRTAFLTDDYIRALQPPTDTDQIIIWDAPDPAIPGTASTYVPGLGIRCTRSGVRAFVMDYRTHTGTQRLTGMDLDTGNHPAYMALHR